MKPHPASKTSGRSLRAWRAKVELVVGFVGRQEWVRVARVRSAVEVARSGNVGEWGAG